MRTDYGMAPLAAWDSRLSAQERALNETLRGLEGARDPSLLASSQVEWQLRGVIYHGRRLLLQFDEMRGELESHLRPGAGAAIFRAVSFGLLMYEFDALVDLAFRTLDRLPEWAAGAFRAGPVPRSLDRFRVGRTDWSLLQRLMTHPDFRYLGDIRQYLRHGNPLAGGRTLLVLRDKAPAGELLERARLDRQPLVWPSFCRGPTGCPELKLSLPDQIFPEACGRGGEPVPFSYEGGVDLVDQAIAFVDLTVSFLLKADRELRELNGPLYSWVEVSVAVEQEPSGRSGELSREAGESKL